MVTLYDMKSATNVPPTADHDQTAATRGRVQRHRHPALRRPPREVVRPLHAQRLRGDLAVAAVDARARLQGERERVTRLPDGKILSLHILGLRQGGGREAQLKKKEVSNFAV